MSHDGGRDFARGIKSTLDERLPPAMYVLFALILDLFYCLYHWGVELSKTLFPQRFMKSVDGEVVVLTGGGSGIGRLMAIKLSQLGATVVTVDVNEEANNETVRMIEELGGKTAYGYKCDLCNRPEIYKVCQRIRREVGEVTMLINNAGIVSGSSFLDTPDEKIVRTFEVNVLSHFWTTKAFLPSMIENKKGHIVSIASLAGFNGINKLVDYCGSKFADVGFEEALRAELYVDGHSGYINSTVICPFFINTGMFAGVQSKIIPILEQDFVAEETVKAIRLNREVVLLPWWTSFLVAIKSFAPSRGLMKVSETFGANGIMNQFEGRKEA